MENSAFHLQNLNMLGCFRSASWNAVDLSFQNIEYVMYTISVKYRGSRAYLPYYNTCYVYKRDMSSNKLILPVEDLVSAAGAMRRTVTRARSGTP